MIEVELKIERKDSRPYFVDAYLYISLKDKCFNYPRVRGWGGNLIRGDLARENTKGIDEAKDGQGGESHSFNRAKEQSNEGMPLEMAKYNKQRCFTWLNMQSSISFTFYLSTTGPGAGDIIKSFRFEL
jgi:hypothetical protein